MPPRKPRIKNVDTQATGSLELHREISRGFDFWNRRYWHGELPLPVFGFHPQPPNGAQKLGHFLPGSWTAGKQEKLDEIVFYADQCLKRGIVEVMDTLVHEMVHLWQQHKGTPGKNNFHNREWHLEAQRVGLLTELRDKKGHDTPGPEFLAALKDFAPKVENIPFRLQFGGRKAPGPTKLRKWICACGYGVRVAIPEFKATCDVCGQKFQLAET